MCFCVVIIIFDLNNKNGWWNEYVWDDDYVIDNENGTIEVHCSNENIQKHNNIEDIITSIGGTCNVIVIKSFIETLDHYVLSYSMIK